MFIFHLQRELKNTFSSPVRLAIFVLYAGLVCWACMDGVSWQRSVQQLLSETPADLLTERSEWLNELAKAEAGEEISPYSARPMSLTFLAIQQPGELAALAHRYESIHPHTSFISGWRSEASLFRRYEVEGPSALQAGRLDLLFIISAVMPFLILMLSVDVLSQERDAGRLRLFLAQGGSNSNMLLSRLFLVSCLAAGIPIAAVLVTGSLLDASALSTGIWAIGILVYALFWAGVAALIAVYTKSSSGSALAALAIWAGIVVLMPSAVQFTAQALHPTPSRVSYLTEARIAEADTRLNVAKRADIYMAEHADLEGASDEEVPGFYRTAFLSNIDINEKTSPMVTAFENAQYEQRQLTRKLQFLAPTLGLQRTLLDAAKAGPSRSASFRKQARDHLKLLHQAIGPATVNRVRLSLTDAQAIPDFTYAEPEFPTSSYYPLIWVVFLGIVFLVVSLRKSHRAV